MLQGEKRNCCFLPIDLFGMYMRSAVENMCFQVDWITPGYDAGLAAMKDFAEHRLKHYDTLRNNPTKDALSNMSPYYHFGQVSTLRERTHHLAAHDECLGKCSTGCARAEARLFSPTPQSRPSLHRREYRPAGGGSSLAFLPPSRVDSGHVLLADAVGFLCC